MPIPSTHPSPPGNAPQPLASGEIDWASMAGWSKEGTAERVAGMVRRAITTGRFPPSFQLSDAAVARDLGISRGPVREAFRQLVGEGLLRGEPNRGVFVMGLDMNALQDLYVARSCIEETAAIMLATPQGRAGMGALRERLGDIHSAVASDDWATIVNADLAFHETLVRSGGSEHLSQLFSSLSAEARTYLHWLESVYRDRSVLPEEHRQIVESIEGGDEPTIRAVISTHMAEASRRLSSSSLVLNPAPPAGDDVHVSLPAPAEVAEARQAAPMVLRSRHRRR